MLVFNWEKAARIKAYGYLNDFFPVVCILHIFVSEGSNLNSTSKNYSSTRMSLRFVPRL